MKNQKVIIDISTKSIFRIVGVLLLILFLYLIRDIIAVVLIAIIIVTALSPMVTKLHKFKIPRALSVISFYVFFFGTLGVLMYSIVPQLADQIKEIAKDMPKFIEQFNQFFGQVPQHEEIALAMQEGLKGFAENLTSSAGNIFAPLFSVFGGLVTFFIILILTLYMSVAEDDIKTFFQSIFPKKYEAKVEKNIEKVQAKIGDWLRGEFVLMFAVGVLSFIGLWLLGVEFALTLAVIAGILELIPFLGPAIAAVPAAFIGFTQSPFLGFAVILLYVIIQQFENHVLVPKVMEKTTGISPVVVVLAILIGAKLFGFLGILLAVPVAVILSVFVQEILDKNSTE